MTTKKAIKEITALGFKPYQHEGASGVVRCSSETGDISCDYYEADYPWIAPELRQWADENGLYWEWQNAGEIVAFEA